MKSSKLTAFLFVGVTFLALTPPPSVEGIKCFFCFGEVGARSAARNANGSLGLVVNGSGVDGRQQSRQAIPCSKPAEVECPRGVRTCGKLVVTVGSGNGEVLKGCGGRNDVVGCKSATDKNPITGETIEGTGCVCEGNLCNGGPARPGAKIGLLTLILLGLSVFIPFALIKQV